MKDSVFNPKDGSIIRISNTWLYVKTTKTVPQAGPGEPNTVVEWRPYCIKDHGHLETLLLGLTGDERSRDTMIWENTYIRFGWLDKSFNSLEWVPISKLWKDYVGGTITKRHRTKLNHICRLLFISIKDLKDVG